MASLRVESSGRERKKPNGAFLLKKISQLTPRPRFMYKLYQQLSTLGGSMVL